METKLSPLGAFIMGSFAILCGVFIALIGLGMIDMDPGGIHAPYWVIDSAGLMFILAGIATINGYAWGRKEDSVSQSILGAGIVGMLMLVFGWIVFGPGERSFTASLPFYNGEASERLGRTVFGIGFAFASAVFVTILVRIFRRISR